MFLWACPSIRTLFATFYWHEIAEVTCIFGSHTRRLPFCTKKRIKSHRGNPDANPNAICYTLVTWASQSDVFLWVWYRKRPFGTRPTVKSHRASCIWQRTYAGGEGIRAYIHIYISPNSFSARVGPLSKAWRPVPFYGVSRAKWLFPISGQRKHVTLASSCH